MTAIGSTFNRLLQRAGFQITPLVTTGVAPADAAILKASRAYTMASNESILAVIDAARYVVRAGIHGAFVECGVWKGGSTMAAAYTLLEERAADRDLFLFDTFEGMPEPEETDVDFSGQPAMKEYLAQRTEGGGSTWCAASLDEVRANLEQTRYPAERIKLVKGRVEETIPGHGPEQIALLRLDTDWYSSTLHELVHFYPRLSTGGVLIIDDYGHWAGARRAVDEYFAKDGRPFLSRIDYTGRIGIKPA